MQGVCFRATYKLLRPMITCVYGSSFHLKVRKMNSCLEISVPQTLRYHEFYITGGKKKSWRSSESHFRDQEITRDKETYSDD